MSIRVLLGVADQVLSGELKNRIDALEEYEIVQISESSQDLVSAVLNHSPDLLIIDRKLPPGPLGKVTQELSTRRPALPILLAARADDSDALAIALEIGARGVITMPLVLAEMNDALQRAMEWSERMLNLLAGGGADSSAQGGITVFAGSKGGVGTSVITTHCAWMLTQERPDLKVCLVDLDLEKGDVPSYVDLSHRVSIVDLAKIADDITDRVVRDTVAVHEGGLHILPAPVDVRDADLVTASAVRSILAQLRQMYDVVFVDGGSNVTPAQAAAVEMSDHTVQVVTTDVPSLRAARRQTEAWVNLGVTNAGDVRVLVNKFSRKAEIQQSTIDRLVLGHRLDVMIADVDRALEAAVNTRTPSQGTPKVWWKSLRDVLAEAGIVAPASTPPSTKGRWSGRRKAAVEEDPPESAAKESASRRKSESGQASIETVGVFPITVMLVIVLWQLIGLGLSFLWAGHAANAAGREASLGSSHSQIVQAAEDSVPSAIRSVLTVKSAGNNVTVSVKLAPWGSGVAESPIGVDRNIVKEPNP